VLAGLSTLMLVGEIFTAIWHFSTTIS